jgi:hypothetical protein
LPAREYPQDRQRCDARDDDPKRDQNFSHISPFLTADYADIADKKGNDWYHLARFNLNAVYSPLNTPSPSSVSIRVIRGQLILRFLLLNIILQLLFENLEGQGAILEHGVVEFALIEIRSEFLLGPRAQFLNL